MLNIKLLGVPAIERDSTNISDKLGSKEMYLISLLLAREKPVAKTEIIELLWPKSNDGAARANLRYALWDIKKVIDKDENNEDFIIAKREYCKINQKYIFKCDIKELRNISYENVLENIKFLNGEEDMAGTYLEGYYFKYCDKLNEKLLRERMNLEGFLAKKFLSFQKRCLREKKYKESLIIGKQLSKFESYNEEVAICMVKSYIGEDRRAEAIEYYEDFEKKLMKDLGIVPKKELLNLIKKETRVYMKPLESEEASNIYVASMDGIEFGLMAEIVKKILALIDEETID